MIAEHNDTASALPNIFMLRFTGFGIGPVRKELEQLIKNNTVSRLY